MTTLLLKLFVKDYQNTKNATVRARYGTFAGAVGIITNLLVSLAKLTVGIIAASVSVIADAANNLTDAASSVITLVGFKLSGKPADREHPYGHARIEYLTGLIISFFVCILGATFLKESIAKIITPTESDFSTVALVVLGISVVAKLWQGFFYRTLSKKIASASLKASAQDSFNDVIATTAVFAGALINKLTALNLDGYIGCAIAVFILVSGIKLVIETASPLLGAPPEEETVKGLTEKILSYDGVIGIHDMIIHSYGANRIFASVHVEVPAEEDVMTSHDIIDNIEEDVYAELGIQLVIHLDPVTTGDERINDMKKTLSEILADLPSAPHFHDFRAVFGITHDNIIFDVVLPMEYKMSDDEVIAKIRDAFTQQYPQAICKIRIDHDFNGTA